MKAGRAIILGIVGCVLVLGIVWVGGRLEHTDADLSALAAAVLFARADGLAWIGGFITQLVVGAIAGLVYAACFEWVTERAGPLIGLAIGIPHAIVAGIIIGLLPGQRMLDAAIAPPGAFYEYRGLWCVIAVVLAHLVFGTFVGALYGPTRHTYARSHRRWAEVQAEPLTLP